MQKKSFKAFSLVELSVVIIIIGILITGVTQGSRLIDESRIKVAKSLTANSRINSLESLILWYEPVLDSSFVKGEAVDGKVISQWNDNNPQNSTRLNAKAAQATDSSKITYNMVSGANSTNTSGPTYVEDGINHIPTLRFTNAATTHMVYLAVDAAMRNLGQQSATLFVVVRYRSGSGFFIDRVCQTNGVPVNCSAAANLGQPLFGFHVGTDGSLFPFVRSDSGAFSSLVGGWVYGSGYDSGYDLVSGKSYILTLQRDYNNNFVLYVNGSSAYSANSTKADTAGESMSLDPYKIGAGSAQDTDVDISEFIFFSGSMKKNDRYAVEDYLGKKYGITVTHN
jgi:prepilin-type N-terminal cleavage/methylation domain-containing protein